MRMMGSRAGRGITRPAPTIGREGWGYPARDQARPLAAETARPLRRGGGQPLIARQGSEDLQRQLLSRSAGLGPVDRKEVPGIGATEQSAIPKLAKGSGRPSFLREDRHPNGPKPHAGSVGAQRR